MIKKKGNNERIDIEVQTNQAENEEDFFSYIICVCFYVAYMCIYKPIWLLFMLI